MTVCKEGLPYVHSSFFELIHVISFQHKSILKKNERKKLKISIIYENNNNITTTPPTSFFFYFNTKIMCIVIDKHKTYLLLYFPSTKEQQKL